MTWTSHPVLFPRDWGCFTNTSIYEIFTCKMKQKSRGGEFIKNTLLFGIVSTEGFIESADLTIRVRLCQFTSGHKVASWWSHHRQDSLEKHSGFRLFVNCSKPWAISTIHEHEEFSAFTSTDSSGVATGTAERFLQESGKGKPMRTHAKVRHAYEKPWKSSLLIRIF